MPTFLSQLALTSALASPPSAPAPIELPPAVVEVSAAGDAGPPLTTGVATVVHPDELAASGESLADVLTEAPGVHLRKTGVLGAHTALFVRGLPQSNLALVVDDVPVHGASIAALDLGLLPIEDIERVEIYRGAGPVRFDSPMGGLVRVVTRPPTNTWQSAARATLGSWSTRGLSALTRGPAGEWRLALALGYDGTAGDFRYYDDRATYAFEGDDVVARRRNNHFDRGYARVGADRDGPAESTIGVRLAGHAHAQGVAGSGLLRTERTSAREREGLARLSLADALLAGGRLRAGLALDALLARRTFSDPAREVGLRVGDATSVLSRYGADARLELLHTLTHETELAPRASFEAFTQRGASNVAGSRGLDHERAQIALGLEHRADLSPMLRLVLGARLEQVRDAGAGGPAESERAASPRLGVLLLAEPCELRANAGRFHRFPTTLERFGDGVTSASNLHLGVERGLSADLGLSCASVRRARTTLAVDAAAFVTRTDGLIVLLPSSQFFLRAENLGRTDISGLEAAARLRRGLVALDATYTLTDARDDSDVLGFAGKQAPGIPRHRARGGLELGPEDVSVRYELTYVALTQLNRANLDPAPARLSHDLSARARYAPLGLELRLAVTNLTDRLHEEAPLGDASGSMGTAGVRDFTGYPLPGRGWSFTLIWRDP